MKCVTCGLDNPAEAKYCSACGSPLVLSAQNDALPVKTRLHNGTFSVGKVLGQGGFGITYKGAHIALNRVVAIKEFFPQGAIRHHTTVRPERKLTEADYNAIKAKFIEEARLLARFAHPGIARVFDVFEENNTAYIVMEFLEGQSLQGRIDKGNLNENEVVDLAKKIGAALSEVHSAGLIHRDIKPDNIMLTKEGRVVLIDFGTARSFTSDKTSRHTAMLTLGYAPLEQYSHHARFGPWTDVYALGATLYHAITGEIPPSATDIINGVELKAPHTLNHSISPNVSLAMMWAMKTKATERPQSIGAFLDAFKKSVGPISILPPVAPRVPSLTPLRSEVRVSKSGQGQYTSLRAAVKAVAPGTRIVVEPGVYHEPNGIVLDKQLEIIGPGIGPKTARIISDQAHCLDVRTDQAVVCGLSLCCNGTPRGTNYGAVNISRGQIVLEKCDLSSTCASCLYIRNNAAPTVRGCRIHDGKKCGVLISENGRGIIEDCDISNNSYAGIQIRTDANPTIRKCRIRSGQQSGIYVRENGRGVIEDCGISGNNYAGIEIKTGANPVIRKCDIHNGKQNGVQVHESGRGTIDNCSIFSNALSGIGITTGANPTIRGCRINRNGHHGVLVRERSSGTIENCDLTGNVKGATNVERGAQPTLRQNKP